jgi:hypothetical protein
LERKEKGGGGGLKCMFKVSAVKLITETCQFSYKQTDHNMLVQLRENILLEHNSCSLLSFLHKV